MNKEGLVVNAKSSFFYCLVDDEIIECRASKKLKLNKQKIITGDYVVIDMDQNYIIDIKERFNELKRPLVANVDASLLVFSAIEPKISYMLLDKLILLMEDNNLDINIVITKMDLLEKEEQQEIISNLDYYQSLGYNVYYKDRDLDKIKQQLVDKKFIFTGQSGVGKSTLINELIPDINIKTQEISQALNRGKHTTRELTFYPYQDGFIIDTPGFSSLDLDLSKEEIRDLYIDFYQLSSECRFNGCYHLKEPDCNVKKHLGESKMFDIRYYNYQELQNNKE